MLYMPSFLSFYRIFDQIWRVKLYPGFEYITQIFLSAEQIKKLAVVLKLIAGTHSCWNTAVKVKNIVNVSSFLEPYTGLKIEKTKY